MNGENLETAQDIYLDRRCPCIHTALEQGHPWLEHRCRLPPSMQKTASPGYFHQF